MIFKTGNSSYNKKNAINNLEEFLLKWEPIYPAIRQKFDPKDLDYYFAYLDFPHETHRMIYTTNWIERLNRSIRRTQRFRCSFPSIESAMKLICSCIIDLEDNFYLKHPVNALSAAKTELDEMIEHNYRI